MTLSQIVAYALVVPIAAWLVAEIVERTHKRLEREAHRRVDPRLKSLYCFVSTAAAAYAFWLGRERFFSGFFTATAVWYLQQLIDAFKAQSAAATSAP